MLEVFDNLRSKGLKVKTQRVCVSPQLLFCVDDSRRFFKILGHLVYSQKLASASWSLLALASIPGLLKDIT